MSWTPYVLSTPTALVTYPVLAGGFITNVEYVENPGTFDGSISFLQMNPSTGGVGDTFTTVGAAPNTAAANLITDGINVYWAFNTIAPSGNLAWWPLSSPAFNNAGIISDKPDSLVSTGGSTGVILSESGSNPSASYFNALPATSGAYNSFGSYSNHFTQGAFDGSSVWSPLNGSTTLLELNPSAVTVSASTMPAATAGNNQIGYDGSYLYIAANGGGVIVWDIGGGSGSVVGSTSFNHCYYSVNLGLVILADTSGNIYTMSSGGGSPTLIGNAVTITGTSGSAFIFGFCDGPSGDLWATVVCPGDNNFNIQYTLTPFGADSIQMIL